MSWGQALLTAGASFFDEDDSTGDFLRFGSGLLGAVSAERNAREGNALARASLAQRQALAQAQLGMAREEIARDRAAQNRLYGMAGEIGRSMSSAYEALGPAYVPNQADVQENYRQLRDQAFRDVDRTVDRVVSSGYAEDIARGRDGMRTLQRDIRSENIRRFSEAYQDADQSAFDAALARTGGLAEMTASGRAAALREYGTVTSAQFDAERAIRTNNGSALANGAFNSLNSIGRDISAGASSANKAAGDQWARFMETDAPYIGRAFGFGSMPEPPNEDEPENSGVLPMNGYGFAYPPRRPA